MKLKKFAPQKNAAQAIVEFAIVLPILLLLLYGLLEAGRLLFVYSSVVTASRQAARYGSATGMGEDWRGEGGPDNSGVPRYQDCYGIRRAAHQADYLRVVNAFDIAVNDIEITYDNGVDPATGNPIAIAPPWADNNNICNGTTDANVTPSNNNTTRIVVRVRGHFTSIVPRIVPFLTRIIEATSRRTILVAVSIQVAAAGGPADPQLANIVDSSSPGPGQPGVTQPGQGFTLTATINGTAGPAAGTLVFSFNGTVICANVQLVNGTAACDMSLPYTGNVTISFTPDDPTVYNAKDFTVLHTVGPSETITTVVASPTQTLPGGQVTVSVLVTNKYGGTVPTGTVAISTVAGNCNITLVNGQGYCPSPLVFNDIGTYNIDAVYTPTDTDHLSSSGFTTHAVVTEIQPPTNTPVPPTAIPTTPAPPTVTPVPGCNTINTDTGPISISGKTMSLTLKNTNNYPVAVKSVFLAWNFAAGHTTGDTSLWLQKADANGTVFWTGNVSQAGALLPLSTAVIVPANGTLKITFTFDKIYDRISSNEQVQIQFATPGCQEYPVVRPANKPTITPFTNANLKLQLVSGGTDNNNESQFWFRVQNAGTGPGTKISVRIYFQTDPSLSATDYALDKISDDSPGSVATITGPTLLSGKVYYYTISYGTASLPVGSTWTFQARLRATSGKYDATNDWWHTSGALPGGGTWTDWTKIPVYIDGNRVWGIEP